MQNFTELTLPTEGKLQYLEDSPVAIINSKLLKNPEGKMFASLELKSMINKNIIAVKVSFDTFDIEGKQLEGIEEYSYLDLMMQKGNIFGKSHLIPFPDNNTRNFTTKVKLVVFDDMSKWTNENAFDVFESQKPLLDVLLTSEIVDTYKTITSAASCFVPEENEKIWRCSCGCLNAAEDEKCLNCSIEKETIFGSLDAEKLAEKKAEFDTAAAEKEAAAAVKFEIKQKEAKKDFKLFAVTLAVSLIITLIMSIVNGGINNKKLITQAQKYFEDGENAKAVEMLYEHPSIRKKCSEYLCYAADVKFSEIKTIGREKKSSGYYYSSSYYLYTIKLENGHELTVKQYLDD